LKASFHTLGCKLNFSETSTIGQQFLQNGFEIVDFKEKADVCVINTCSVTDNAEKECRQLVRRIRRLNPDTFIAVTGCYAQLRPDDIAAIDGVDAVFGNSEKFKLFSLLENFNKNEMSCVYVNPTETLSDFNPAYSTDADSRTRAFLKIQDGCDYSCTFCTIPLARGKSRSQDEDSIIDEFKSLLLQDYKEIILTGVNVGDYGRKQNLNLFHLLKRMIEIPGEFRIRISSIEPNLLTDEIIDLTAASEKLCNHFHIPLQSGSSKILRLMKRRYTAEFFKKLIIKINSKIKNVGIGVDIIVGTPGETEEDFLTTYNFIKDLQISYLHVFTYSERPMTEAIEMEGKVDYAERKKRNNMLRILSDKKRNLFYQKQIGNELEVLFERNRQNGNMLGFSSNYVRVSSPLIFDLVNTLTNVKIAELDENFCLTEHKKISTEAVS